MNLVLAGLGAVFFLLKKKVQLPLLNSFLNYRYKQKMAQIGAGVRFNGVSHIDGYDSVVIEDNVHIGNNAFIKGEGGLKIGENTHISRNLVLYTINHDYHGLRLPYDEKQLKRPVVIGRNVWIGMNVVILPGTTIGEGAIIGAGSTVYGDIEPLSIVGAAKPTTIKYRDKVHYDSLDQKRSYGGRNGEEMT